MDIRMSFSTSLTNFSNKTYLKTNFKIFLLFKKKFLETKLIVIKPIASSLRSNSKMKR